MSADYDDEMDEYREWARKELRAASKRYQRSRGIREWGLMIFLLAGGSVPSGGRAGSAARTRSSGYVGLFVLARLEQMHNHIRAIQIRLAGMNDDLDRLSNKEDGGGHLLGEFSEGA